MARKVRGAANPNYKHGYAPYRNATGIYELWKAMRQRCENPNHQSYSRYGGRGVRVCDRWQQFENFLADMGDKPKGRTLDRINNDGNYEQSNCRWATKTEQTANSRTVKNLTFGGKTMFLSDWDRHLGLNRGTVGARLRNGWTIADAVSKEKQRNQYWRQS